jgi:hypothetical protein
MKLTNVVKQATGRGRILLGITGNRAEIRGILYYLYNNGIIDLPRLDCITEKEEENLANHFGQPNNFQYISVATQTFIEKRANQIDYEMLTEHVENNREKLGKMVHTFLDRLTIHARAVEMARAELDAIPTKTFYRSRNKDKEDLTPAEKVPAPPIDLDWNSLSDKEPAGWEKVS